MKRALSIVAVGMALLATPVLAETAKDGAKQAGTALQVDNPRSLIGMSVRSTAGNVLGEVDSVMVTPDGGIDRIVVAVGGDFEMLGADAKHITIEGDTLSRAPTDQALVTSLAAGELKAAPRYMRDGGGDKQQASGERASDPAKTR